jgi:hypothetical protein
MQVRFLGQFPEDMVRGERALREMRRVMGLVRDVALDMMNAEMPGVLLEVHQQQRVWADHFLSQLVPPDFLELCQIAATQQNRSVLFGDSIW